MSATSDHEQSRAIALRNEFDASFSRAAEGSVPETMDLLLVRSGESIVAVPTTSLAATELGRAIVRTPDAPAGMLGVSGLRGTLIAVYDLAHGLGGTAPPPETRGVLLIPKGRPTLALRVSAIEGHVRVPMSRILPVSPSSSPSAVSSYVQTDAGRWPVYDVEALVSRLLEASTRD